MPSGRKRSGGLGRSVSPKNDAAVTPTTVTGTPLTTNLPPTTDESRPY
jgi:hypothetical protein